MTSMPVAASSPGVASSSNGNSGPPPTLSSRYRIASIAWSEAFESASSTLPVVACGRFSSSCSSFGQVRKMWIIGQVAQPTVR